MNVGAPVTSGILRPWKFWMEFRRWSLTGDMTGVLPGKGGMTPTAATTFYSLNRTCICVRQREKRVQYFLLLLLLIISISSCSFSAPGTRFGRTWKNTRLAILLPNSNTNGWSAQKSTLTLFSYRANSKFGKFWYMMLKTFEKFQIQFCHHLASVFHGLRSCLITAAPKRALGFSPSFSFRNS